MSLMATQNTFTTEKIVFGFWTTIQNPNTIQQSTKKKKELENAINLGKSLESLASIPPLSPLGLMFVKCKFGILLFVKIVCPCDPVFKD